MALFGRPSEKDQRRADRMREWASRQNIYAMASVVLGAVSLVEFGVLLIFGIGGAVTGIIALVQLADPVSPRTEGRKLAIIGIACSAISLAIAAMIYTWHPLAGPVKVG